MKKEKGFTLLELMVVIGIMGILTALAMPSYRNMQANSKIRSAISSWQDSFYLAQAEAMRVKRNITLCPSELGNECSDGFGFEKGWIVAEIVDGKPNYILKDELPLEISGLKISLNGNSNTISFTANGNIRGFQGRTLCASLKNGGKMVQRAVVISSEGRMRISDQAKDISKCNSVTGG